MIWDCEMGISDGFMTWVFELLVQNINLGLIWHGVFFFPSLFLWKIWIALFWWVDSFRTLVCESTLLGFPHSYIFYGSLIIRWFWGLCALNKTNVGGQLSLIWGFRWSFPLGDRKEFGMTGYSKLAVVLITVSLSCESVKTFGSDFFFFTSRSCLLYLWNVNFRSF